MTWAHVPSSRLDQFAAVPVMLFSLVGIRLMSLPVLRKIPRQCIDGVQRILTER